MRSRRLGSVSALRRAAAVGSPRSLAVQAFTAILILTCVFGTRIAVAGSPRVQLLVKFHASATAQQKAGVLAAAGAQQAGAISDLGVKVVSVPTGAKNAALRTIRGSRLVSFAEPDGTLKPQDDLPDDPSFPQQFAVGGGAWGWYATHTTQAWDITQGSASTVIAILDTGMNVSAGLDDFSGQLVPGWNVLTNSSNTSTNQLHGTYVAGVAGMKADNGTGSAGVCPQCKIMPVVVGTDSGASWSDMATGITWATDHGARVINMSWAGTSDSTTIQNAINYAHSKGVVLFAAAGNTNCDCRNYPAADQNVIGVAGIGSSGTKAGDSNYGNWVAVAAPEGDMTAWPTINGSPGYAPVGGTSMASPFAAGIAGLLLSANPNLTNAQVEQTLEQTAAPVSFSIAYGRVDALAALQSLGLADPQPSSLPVNGSSPQIMVETNGDWNYAALGTGAPQPGQVLLRGQGSWTGSAPLSLSAVKWQRCDASGASCTVVSTASKYTVQSTDVGFSFKLSITVKNNLGSTTAESTVSQPVGGSGGGGTTATPANTSPPTISGTAQDGQTLSASTGSWSGSPTSYTYQWKQCDSSGANCSAVSGATGSSYSLSSADVGSTMAVAVTASNAGGSATAQSAPSGVVAAQPPQSTAPPTVSGTDATGQTLQSSAGSWMGTAPLSYAYQWQRCDSSGSSCGDVSGATSNTYTLTSADAGSTMRVHVSASNSAGSANATSQPTAPVASSGQSLSFSGTLNKNTTSLAFPVTIGAGEVDATLTFSKGGTATVQLLDASGAVVAKVSGRASPLKLNVPGLAAGTYSYVVTCSGYKGSFSFTLAVKAPSP
jgi:thermitase